MSNYERHDRQDETAMWDAGEVRRQESAQQDRRRSRKRSRSRAGLAIYLVCVVLGSCLLAGVGWLLVNDLCSLNKAPVEVEIVVEEGDINQVFYHPQAAYTKRLIAAIPTRKRKGDQA